MLQVQIIGNLGADAEVKTANGREFVSFNVAHSEKWTGADGVEHESTTWVSCAMNGNGGNILPYLKKGTSVYCLGRASLRVYSSPKEKRMVAGLNLSVDRIELVGGRVDEVPRQVMTADGRILRTYRAYYVDMNEAKDILPTEGQQTPLQDAGGRFFSLDINGFVWPVVEQKPAENG